MSNIILNISKHAKNNDEFYTTQETVSSEIEHYKNHFYNRTVYCNCDNPTKSEFFFYFIRNFNSMHLRKLYCSGIEPSENCGYFAEITDVKNYINENTCKKDIVNFILKFIHIKKIDASGDFRSSFSQDIMKNSDIVVTNPPFSLFQEWIDLVIQNKKKFIVIGNSNAICYKNIFPLLLNNKAWIGQNYGEMQFKVPDHYPKKKYRFWIDENGQKWRSIGNAMWLTNLDIARRHKKIKFTRNFDRFKYEYYDTFNAIEVPKVKDIPYDFDGLMGVPITFLNKHNPEQFEIIGVANHGQDNKYDLFKPTINGVAKYKRLIIKWRKKQNE